MGALRVSKPVLKTTTRFRDRYAAFGKEPFCHCKVFQIHIFFRVPMSKGGADLSMMPSGSATLLVGRRLSMLQIKL